jgi:hypothetical protein
MSLRKKGRQQLRQKISVHWTRKKLRNTPLFASLAHFLSNWPRIPSPFNLLPPPPQDPSPSARWFVVTGELCLCRLHLYLSLSQSPTYLSPQHPNHNHRRRNPNLCRHRGSGPSTTFLPLRRRFGYTPPPIPLSRLHFSPHAPLFLPEPNYNQICRSQFASWPQRRWWQQGVNVGTHLQVCGILQLSLLQ